MIWLFRPFILTDPFPGLPSEETRKIQMAILGSKGAGKTTLWNKLRGVRNGNSVATAKEDIDDFDFNRCFVRGCVDIGGGDDYVTKYDDILHKNVSIIYFIVDINRLEEQKKEIRARLRKITKILNDKKMFSQIVLLATHKDTFTKAKDTSLFIEKILDLDVQPVFNKSRFFYRAVNLLDDKEIDKIKEEIYKKADKYK